MQENVNWSLPATKGLFNHIHGAGWAFSGFFCFAIPRSLGWPLADSYPLLCTLPSQVPGMGAGQLGLFFSHPFGSLGRFDWPWAPLSSRQPLLRPCDTGRGDEERVLLLPVLKIKYPRNTEARVKSKFCLRNRHLTGVCSYWKWDFAAWLHFSLCLGCQETQGWVLNQSPSIS